MGSRFYRRLLRLYPRSFRLEYEHELAALFEARSRRRPQRPALLGLGWWLSEIGDVFANALRSHADVLALDLRFALRSVRRAPGFSALVIVVTALGVGATTATFSVTDHVLLRPLPFPEPDRVIKVYQEELVHGYPRLEPSPLNYLDWKAHSGSFERLGAHSPVSVNWVGDGEPERLDANAMDADVLAVLRVRPALGRGFVAEDSLVGAPQVAILSHGLWRERFGEDPDVLGTEVRLDDLPATVVGVMPRGFTFPDRFTRLWVPLRFEPNALLDRDNNYLRVIGRLAPGIDLDQARGEMSAIAHRLEAQYPAENAHSGIALVRMRDEMPRQSRHLLAALCAAALCVLLIACTNLANVLLARGMARRGELALRATLGAGRERLVRQTLTESLVLATAGGLLGALLAIGVTPLVARLVPTALPVAEAPAVDLRVFAIATLAAVLTGVGFGLAPALRSAGHGAADLQERGRSGLGGRRERARSGLVIAQVALSVLLLVACGLLLRALARVEGVDPGFARNHAASVLTLRTTLPRPKYDETARRVGFYGEVLEGVRALPGVSDAAYISFLPMVMRGGIWPVGLDGNPPQEGEARRSVSLRFVTPGFFAAMGIPLKSGRDIQWSDTFDAPFVAVVSESFVRQNFPESVDSAALDREIHIAFHGRRVVGVVGDVRVRGLEQESEPQVYLAAPQVVDGAVPSYAPKDLVVRLGENGGQSEALARLLPSIRQIVRRADPLQPISNVRTLEDILEAETGPRTAQLRLLASFGAIALALAGIGLYGLLSFSVTRRLPEIGVRVVLGAKPRDILRLVLRNGLVLAGSGLSLGLLLALATAQGLRALLAGIHPHDPTAYLAASALSLLAILAGSLVPALRALRVDPTAAIRSE